jgi:hypothetical protein
MVQKKETKPLNNTTFFKGTATTIMRRRPAIDKDEKIGHIMYNSLMILWVILGGRFVRKFVGSVRANVKVKFFALAD